MYPKCSKLLLCRDQIVQSVMLQNCHLISGSTAPKQFIGQSSNLPSKRNIEMKLLQSLALASIGIALVLSKPTLAQETVTVDNFVRA